MKTQLKLHAEYNQLMNQRLYSSVAQLSDKEIKEDKGAFFKSIFGTLNHILVGDILWLGRFSALASSYETLSYVASLEKPKALDDLIFDDFTQLKQLREKVDLIIIEWINSLSNADLNTKLNYKNMQGITFKKDVSSLIDHLFLHQVHHRGQVTTLLSQASIDFGETDIIEIIP